jgi:hypothetical protein
MTGVVGGSGDPSQRVVVSGGRGTRNGADGAREWGFVGKRHGVREKVAKSSMLVI